ncbi:MAG: DUF305 domain-containing protein [Kastovskya adunca ATA6-11-RM4]|jgi:uncharacterized protein (DUF305 family)|nr:DUF305 domain-containing protein [Kastovskya adunca ATA6-11-RM4]
MQPISFKNSLFAIIFAIASLGGVAACSPHGQHQAESQTSPATDTGAIPGMDHGNMDHSMAMDLGPADANYDLRFVDAMIPHHQGAIEMAKEAQQKSQRPEIKQLAEAIIKEQEREIGQLRQWRQAWYPQAGDRPMAYHPQMGHMMEMSPEQTESMKMSQDLGAADGEFDLRLIDAMTPHHEGAVVMAEDALSKSQRPEIKELARNIIASQQREIEQMKQWRQSWKITS